MGKNTGAGSPLRSRLSCLFCRLLFQAPRHGGEPLLIMTGLLLGVDIVISTRLLATAFLFNDNDLLLMQRSSQAKFLPGLWAPVGGHIEAGEFCTPQVACEREISEETGLSAQDICNLSLRYIVHRIHQGEIRVQYCYFGTTTKRDLGTTDEGELHWMPFENVSTLSVSATTRFTLEHYAKIGSQTNVIYVGSVSAPEGKPAMLWSPLSDWE